MRRAGLFVASLLALALLPRAATARQVIPLDGVWQAVAGELSAPPGDGAAWAPAPVPAVGLWRPQGPHATWYRREIDVPTSWAGQHVVVRVGGAKYSQRVYINGKLMGSHLGGFEPAEYDVTSQVVCGDLNDLLIGVGDWTSMLAEGTKAGDPAEGRPVGSWTKEALLAPVGAMGGETGLWGSVTLEGRPRLWVEEVRVEPQVQGRTLRVVVVARNAGVVPEHVTVTGRVTDGGPAPRIAPAETTLEPGKTTTVTLQAEWPGVRLWTPQDPHLYTLIAGLSTGPLVDAQQVTFGFRDFRAQGDAFLLNGTPVRLLSMDDVRTRRSSYSPEAVLAAARAAGATAVHLAGEPWPDSWYDAADRTGMLIIADTALWSMASNCALTKDTFWANARDHVSATVKRLYNHPSVVMWCAESEFLSSGGAAAKGTEQKVGELIDLIHQLDPTRPVMCNGDADPGGKADVIGLSRPHDLPRWTQWPETAFWLDAPAALDSYPAARWSWDRAKPLSLSGFLRLPTTDVRSATAVLGDAAYPDGHGARATAEAAMRSWQIIAARDAGVSVIAGWDIDPGSGAPLVPAQQSSSYHPVAIYDLSANREVFAGSVVTRRLSAVNDSLVGRNLEARWRLEPTRGEWTVTGSAQVSLPPAGVQRLNVDLALPPLEAEVTPAALELELWEGGRLIFGTSTGWNLHGRAPLSGPVPGAPAHIAAYDPEGETISILGAAGIEPELITEENAARVTRRADLMVVGKGALREPMTPTGSAVGRAALDCAQRGGTVLVFEQTRYPQWLIPLALTDHSATVTFPRDRSHPALRGLSEQDMAHWAPDGVVSRDEFRKLDRVGFLPIVDSGGAAGLGTAGLAELRIGRGRFLLCQLDVTRKYDADPAATRIVRNLLACAGEKAPLRRTAAVVDDAAAAQLTAVGLDYDRITGPLRGAPLARYQVLVISDLAQAQQQARDLQEFVRKGGQVILHSIDRDTVAATARLIGHPVTVQKTTSGAVRLVGRSGPAAAISNEELAWFDTDPQLGFPTLSPAVASYAASVPAGEGAVAHAEPGVLISLPSGRGQWVIDQVQWDRPAGHEAEARRYLSTLLTSLGCEPAAR